MKNFLQVHYKQVRDHGGDHAEYVIINDLSDEVADGLREWYDQSVTKQPDAHVLPNVELGEN